MVARLTGGGATTTPKSTYNSTTPPNLTKLFGSQTLTPLPQQSKVTTPSTLAKPTGGSKSAPKQTAPTPSYNSTTPPNLTSLFGPSHTLTPMQPASSASTSDPKLSAQQAWNAFNGTSTKPAQTSTPTASQAFNAFNKTLYNPDLSGPSAPTPKPTAPVQTPSRTTPSIPVTGDTNYKVGPTPTMLSGGGQTLLGSIAGSIGGSALGGAGTSAGTTAGTTTQHTPAPQTPSNNTYQVGKTPTILSGGGQSMPATQPPAPPKPTPAPPAPPAPPAQTPSLGSIAGDIGGASTVGAGQSAGAGTQGVVSGGGGLGNTNTGAGTGSGSAPPSNPNAIDTMTGQAANILNGSMNNTSQWQSQAQQEAAAQYIQQEAAWQTYINQLMDEEGLTNQGYQNQLNQSLNTLNDKSFQDYLQGRQDMADRGLAGSGLDTAQNTQLALAQQQQAGQLQQQWMQQKSANDTAMQDQMNQYKQQMDTLDPQALYDQYYQTISQSGQQAAQQQFDDWMKMLTTAGPYYSPTAYEQGQLNNTSTQNQNTLQNDYWNYLINQGKVGVDQQNADTTAQNDMWNYLINQGKLGVDKQNANTSQFTAQADANYKAVEAQVAKGTLALKSTDDAATIAQKWTQLNQAQQVINNNVDRYAQSNANSATANQLKAITGSMGQIITHMDNIKTNDPNLTNNNDLKLYNSLMGQWQALNSMITGGSVSGN